MRPLHVVTVLAVAPACTITTHNLNIGQVNRPSVPFTSSAPTSGLAAFTAGASSLPTITTPKSTSDVSGAEVPQAQGRGELILRPKKNFFLGGVYEAGFGHEAVTEGLPTVRSGNVWGAGVILGGSLGDDSSNFSVGVNATLMSWSIPYDQFSTAVVDAGIISGVSNYMSSKRESAGTAGLGVWPTWKVDQLRIFGGGYLTQRPRVNLFTTDTTVIDPSLVVTHTEQDVVTNDAFDFTLAAGVEYSVSPEFAVTAIINEEVHGAYMRTGPSLQLAASLRLGKLAADRPPPPAPTTTPPMYGPPPGAPPPYAPPPGAPPPYTPPPPDGPPAGAPPAPPGA